MIREKYTSEGAAYMDLEQFEEKAKGLGVLGVKVTQHGREIAYKNWDEECRRNIYSASKSVTSCAVGFAIQEGLLSLSERLVDAFHGDLPEHIDGNLEQATVRDLLTMCLGQDAGHLMGAQRPLYKEKDWVKLALSLPFAYKPGTKFVYNNVGPYLAGILVQRRSGCDLVSYLPPRLFDHLGITRPTWEADPLGHTFGAGGLFFTLSELHTFGRFYLERGKWNGRQLLAPEWVDESTKKQVDNGALGYGYLFWGGEQGTFRADGKYGQLSILCRDKDAVITVVAECRDVPSLNRAIFDQIYPQL